MPFGEDEIGGGKKPRSAAVAIVSDVHFLIPLAVLVVGVVLLVALH